MHNSHVFFKEIQESFSRNFRLFTFIKPVTVGEGWADMSLDGWHGVSFGGWHFIGGASV